MRRTKWNKKDGGSPNIVFKGRDRANSDEVKEMNHKQVSKINGV